MTMKDQHPLQPQQGPAAQQLPQRPSKKARPQPQKNSPHQNQTQHPGAAFPSPHSLNNGLPLQHHSPYPNPSPSGQHAYSNPSQNGQQGPDVFYTASPYGTPVSGHYSAPEPTDIMAAAHLQQQQQQQRQPYPVYHTPQSNSPVSVTSSQGHDQHAARMYSQPPQMHNGMYYQQPQMPYGQSPYPQHPSQPIPQQHQMMTSQPGMPQPPMPHQQAPPPMPHPQHPQHPQHPAQPQGMTNSPRPQTKIEPGLQQRPIETAGIQRAPTAPTSSHPSTPAGPAPNANNLPPAQGGGGGGGGGGPGVNPNAAPGPIPATTPLVVRQDNNGVQWIAFEYSRDRVKMEYTIRCDVESVNVDALDAVFKDENCVYPRACGPKENYRGNRIVYETECNTVGWSLAELNPCLRGKRGLIQRAVDSWRNSNSDSKLRSRRVRRMNKVNTRNKNPGPHAANHMAGPPRDVGGGAAPPNGMPPQLQQQQRPPPPNLSMANAAQMHHHHAHSDAGNPEDQLVNGDYKPQPNQSPAVSQQIRQAHLVQGYPNYPNHPNATSMPSMPPQLYNGLDTHHMQPHPSNTIPASAVAGASQPPNSATTDPSSSPDKKHTSLLPEIEPRKRKFILVEDTERNSKVRVRVNLEGVDIAEIPDSYREANSVYPRSYFPTQMQLSPSSKRERRARGRFADPGQQGVEIESRTQVKLSVVEGGEVDMPAPRLSRAVGEKEEKLNDLGYRMSWSQSRTFAGRVIFLQRSLDAYRNKMKINLTGSKEESVSEVPPLFETRLGKRTWVEQTAGEGRTVSPRIKSLKH